MLFMITVFNDREIVFKYRKKSVKTITNARTFYVIFDEQYVKKLIISEFIDVYNHYMNDVDQTN